MDFCTLTHTVCARFVQCFRLSGDRSLNHCFRSVVHQSINRSISLSTNQSINQSISPSVHPSTNQSDYQSLSQPSAVNTVPTWFEIWICRLQGTSAHKRLVDDVPQEVKNRRFEEITSLFRELTLDVSRLLDCYAGLLSALLTFLFSDQ